MTTTRTALFVSPHLDDVAFSCAGTLAALKSRGWNIKVDGQFGPGTKKIVQAFQRQKGLKADGIVGKNTWTRLWTAKVTSA